MKFSIFVNFQIKAVILYCNGINVVYLVSNFDRFTMKKYLFLLFILTTFSGVSFSQDWKIGSNYKVYFDSDDATGTFDKMSGYVTFDPNHLSGSKFIFSVEVASIATGNFIKNYDAKGSSWFDAEKYPMIKFSSKIGNGFAKTEKGYSVTGTLEIHGVKKTVTIPFTFQNNTIVARFTVNRLDYGVGAKDNGVGTQIHLKVTVPLIKK